MRSWLPGSIAVWCVLSTGCAAVGPGLEGDDAALEDGAVTQEIEVGSGRDAARDVLLRDAPRADAPSADAPAPREAGAADAGRLDAVASDARALDSGVTDSGSVDSGSPDSSATDSGATDAGTGSADAGEPAGAWEPVGFGVTYRDMGAGAGGSIEVVYGGYRSAMSAVQGWATELWRVDLRARGVRHVYAVQGPRDAAYDAREIQNSRLAPHLVARVTEATGFIAVLAHSSGSFPAHELFDQLFNRGRDPLRVTDERIVYYNLDGGSLLLNAGLVTRLRRAYFVWAEDPTINTRSNNWSAAESMGRTYAAQGGAALRLEQRGTGCNRGATWCMHDAVVITRPYNPAHYDVERDYTLFTAERPAQTQHLAATAAALAR